MKKTSFCFKAIERLKEMINSYSFMNENRISVQDFSRRRKLTFEKLICFMLNLNTKTLQIELDRFFMNLLNKKYFISKQAYSKARKKVKPEAFINLNHEMIKMFYKEKHKKWNGYRMFAIDGTSIRLPETKEAKEAFEGTKNQNGKVASASASCIVDVLNNIVVNSTINKYYVSEKEMAERLISAFIEAKLFEGESLILFDRGYAGAKFANFLIEKNIKFIIRVRENHSKNVAMAQEKDQIITMESCQHKVKARVRLIRIQLDSGEEEILLTNLFSKKYTLLDFKELYFKRWGIEVKYDELKNRLQLESFTGNSKIAIEQDFYICILMSNIIQFVRMENDKNIENSDKDKNLKHKYKTNLNMLVGHFKNEVVYILMEKNKRKMKKRIESLLKRIKRYKIPCRLNRSYVRKNKINSNKHAHTLKSSI